MQIEFKRPVGVLQGTVVGMVYPGNYDAVRYRVVAGQGFSAKTYTVKADDVVGLINDATT